MKFQIRELDAWANPEGWDINTAFNIEVMETSAKNIRRAFTHFLKTKYNIVFKNNRTLIEEDWDGYMVIIDRKTKEPLYDAVPFDL